VTATADHTDLDRLHFLIDDDLHAPYNQRSTAPRLVQSGSRRMQRRDV
jgi:hypothetical protein